PAATAGGGFMGGPSADPSPTPVPGDDDREPQPGEVVVGRYRLIDQIGSGGYGVVYRAHDLRSRREVAVKVSDRRQQSSWWTEVKHTAGGRHTAELLNAGVVNNAYTYLVYPLYQPGSLYRFCTTGAGANRDLAWCLKVVEHVLFALGAAHQAGVAHGDV